MKKFFLLLCLPVLWLSVACHSTSPFSGLTQPINTNTNLIYQSDSASISNSTDSPTSSSLDNSGVSTNI